MQHGGVLVEPTDYLSIGAAIHSPVHVPASGTVDVTYPATLDEYVDAFLPSAQLPELSGEIDVDLDIPMLVTAGVLVRPEERWEIALDYSFEHRSSQPSLDFIVTEATSPSIADTQKVQGYRDRHGLNLRVAFSPIELANSLRIVPGSAFAGSVAPMSVRHFLMASGASSTMATIGPDAMNSVSPAKKGRPRWTA